MSKRDVVTHGVTPEHFESDEEKKLRKIEEGRNLWYRKVIRYKKPTESNRQFATRCGLTDGGIVGRWFYEGRKPQKPTEARRILENLGVPEDEAKEIMFGLIGMEPETQTEHDSATRAYSASGDIYLVQQILGHSNITTTMRYAHLEKEKLQRAFNTIDPNSTSIANIAKKDK